MKNLIMQSREPAGQLRKTNFSTFCESIIKSKWQSIYLTVNKSDGDCCFDFLVSDMKKNFIRENKN